MILCFFEVYPGPLAYPLAENISAFPIHRLADAQPLDLMV
jgi:hypothetical protein